MVNNESGQAKSRRPLKFCMFTTNSPAGYPGTPWNQPMAAGHDYRSLKSWMNIAKDLEAAKFDALFWADHSGIYDTFGGSRDAAVRNSVQFPINGPATLISALASVTENLGFAFSENVIQAPPYSFSRRVASLDHLTEGRVAWNIVTSFQRSAWRNVGFEDVATHAERYERAAEYVDVVYKLLEGSWEEGAVVRDTVSGVYADPAKVHPIDHAGKFYSSGGPFCVEPSPQRVPVLFQAGSSSDGRAFSARNAEAVFISAKSPKGAATFVDDLRSQLVDIGRNSEDVLVFQAFTCIVGATAEEAERKSAEYHAFLKDEAGLAYLSAAMGVDLKGTDLDTPIGNLNTEAMQGALRALAEGSPNKSWTFREAMMKALYPHAVGTADQIISHMEEWAASGIDGFNIAFLNGAGELADFAKYLVPELQRRGLMQTDYKSGTLREKWFGSATLNDRHPAAKYRRKTGVGAAQP